MESMILPGQEEIEEPRAVKVYNLNGEHNSFHHPCLRILAYQEETYLQA
jgi:hypothetical protein